jgi:hypothetical protein
MSAEDVSIDSMRRGIWYVAYRETNGHHRKDEKSKNRGHDPPSLGNTPETIEVEALDVEINARDLHSQASAREHGGKRLSPMTMRYH